jgi:uncharacterized protein YegL
MSSYEQFPYNPDTNAFSDGHDDFITNPQQRCPCVLLLDTSGSMQGDPIAELNEGLQAFKSELMADSLAAQRVEVAIVTFGPTKVVSTFQTAESFQPPQLVTTGDTPMGAAIMEGIRLVEERKQVYRQHGVPFNRPWIFLITDGAPTDSVANATKILRAGVEERKFAFFAVGVQNANMIALEQISPRPPVKLAGLKFKELFLWLSSSLGSASRSSPSATTLSLPSPSGWTEL